MFTECLERNRSERLQYIEAPATAVETGLGLGLYITKQIVLAHGAEIHVESTDQTGIQFSGTRGSAVLAAFIASCLLSGPALATGALIYDNGPWTNGVMVSHLLSFAGPKSREDMSLTQIEMEISYTFPNHWYVVSAPTLECDWRLSHGQRWIVPAGVAVGRESSVGSHDLSVQFGAYYNVLRSMGEATWTLNVEFGWVR